jgi:hypothetical protein
VEATLTLIDCDLEVMLEKQKQTFDKLCKYFKASSLHFDDNMVIVTRKVSVFSFTAMS